MRNFIGLLSIILMWSSVSCKHDIPEVSEQLTTDTICDTAKVYFVNDILPLFNTSCAITGCHDAGTAQEGLVFTSYEGIMEVIKAGDPGDSEAYERITESNSFEVMPPSSSGITLTPDQIDLVYNWIAQGAHNNQCTDNGNDCDTLTVTYSGTMVAIIQNNCGGCHTGPITSGIDLSTHSGLSAQVPNLVGAVRHLGGQYSLMPQGGNMLDNCTLDKIEAWVNAGALDN